MTSNRFSKYVKLFLKDYLIDECNYSKETAKSYAEVLYIFIDFINEVYNIKPYKIEIEKIDKKIILEFLNYLEINRKNTERTRNHRLAVLKSFFKYVGSNEPDLLYNTTKILTIKNKKTPDTIISYFSENEIKIIVDYLYKNKDLKTYTMICVLYETAVRVTELINIKVSNIIFEEKNNEIIVFGKGSKVRNIPIDDKLVDLIKYYLQNDYCDFDGNGYLFYSNQKKKYSRFTINYLINEMINKLRLRYPELFQKKYSPHSFRHSKATHLHNNGTPLNYIREFLGHLYLQSTQIYSQVDPNRLRKKIEENAQNIKTNKKYSNSKKEDLDQWLKNYIKR